MKKLVRSVENNRPVPLNVSDFGLPFYLNPNQKAELFISEISESNPDFESVSEKPESKWFEVGGLPPVGTVCDVYNHELGKSAGWERCEILFMGKFKCVYSSDSCLERIGNIDLTGAIEFRPIRTERDKFIDAAEAAFKVSGFDKLTGFGFLYDAGFRLPEQK